MTALLGSFLARPDLSVTAARHLGIPSTFPAPRPASVPLPASASHSLGLGLGQMPGQGSSALPWQQGPGEPSARSPWGHAALWGTHLLPSLGMPPATPGGQCQCCPSHPQASHRPLSPSTPLPVPTQESPKPEETFQAPYSHGHAAAAPSALEGFRALAPQHSSTLK